LPEPPPSDVTSKRRSRNDDDDAGSDAYVKIENDSGTGSLVSRFHRIIPNDDLDRSNRSSCIDECTDLDGYLKPTFHRFSDSDSNGLFSTNSASPTEQIPAESYMSPSDVFRDKKTASHCENSVENQRCSTGSELSYDRPRNALVNQNSTSSENHPLISVSGTN
jgi:hypothetical protein